MTKIFNKMRQKNLAAKRGFNKSNNRGILFAVFVLGFMLITLAVLQYYWLDQLGEAEKIRMKNNLKISTERFAEDFDEELTKIYKTFREITFNDDSEYNDLILTLDRIKGELVDPGLIEKVFIVEIDNGSHFSIKYQIPGMTIENKSTIQEELEIIKGKLKQSQLPFLESIITLCHSPILDKNYPLIVINLFPQSFFELSKNHKDSFIVIKLDNIILKQFLNSLTQKYFFADSIAVYNTAIIKADSNKTMFYSSNPENSADYYLSGADETTDIGQWRTEQFMIAATQISITDTIAHKQVQKIKLKDRNRLSIEVISNDTINKTENFQFLMSKNVPWQVYIKHVSGNLDGLIQDSRMRNLIISYLIILILGLSIGFVFYTSQKARKTARDQIEFVAGLTHELRTPLASIRSAAENLKDGVINSDDQQKKYGKLIYDENLRLTNMIEQTLQFAGLSNGSIENIEKINLSELTRSVLKGIDKAHARKVNLSVPASINIFFNKNALTILVRNLLSNALKYSPDDKQVNVVASVNETENILTMEISDQGPGINRDDLPHIFEPFYRGSFAKEKHIAGSGIGLSLVKKIMDEHNGQVDVSTNIGKGSSFTIKLPVSGNNKNV